MKTPEEYADELHTPRELCRDCWEWIDEDGDANKDYPHCAAKNFYETHRYLHHQQETCKEHFEY